MWRHNPGLNANIINSLGIMLDRWQGHKTTSEFLKDTVTVTRVNTRTWSLEKGMTDNCSLLKLWKPLRIRRILQALVFRPESQRHNDDSFSSAAQVIFDVFLCFWWSYWVEAWWASVDFFGGSGSQLSTWSSFDLQNLTGTNWSNDFESADLLERGDPCRFAKRNTRRIQERRSSSTDRHAL